MGYSPKWFADLPVPKNDIVNPTITSWHLCNRTRNNMGQLFKMATFIVVILTNEIYNELYLAIQANQAKYQCPENNETNLIINRMVSSFLPLPQPFL